MVGVKNPVSVYSADGGFTLHRKEENGLQEFSINSADLDRLTEKLEKAPAVLGWARRQAMISAADQFKALMDTAIGGSGRVKNWQQSYVGSGGGYAAVRPRAKTYAESRGKQTFEERRRAPHPTYAVGYITNAINSGHRTPSHRMGQAKGLRGFRVDTSGYVGGKGFYEAVQAQSEAIGEAAAQEILDALFKHLEG